MSSSATLGTYTAFVGNIMAVASITMNNGATLEGSALGAQRRPHAGQPMIFGRLDMLRPGDRIIVVLSDKSRRRFLVVRAGGVGPAGSGRPQWTTTADAGHLRRPFRQGQVLVLITPHGRNEVRRPDLNRGPPRQSC